MNIQLNMELTNIIPFYNEERGTSRILKRTDNMLLTQDYKESIIIYIDGCVNNKSTLIYKKRLIDSWDKGIFLSRNPAHQFEHISDLEQLSWTQASNVIYCNLEYRSKWEINRDIDFNEGYNFVLDFRKNMKNTSSTYGLMK